MELQKLQDWITAARILLQDKVFPYRYPDEDLASALNFAFTECSRIRPDILLEFKYTGRSRTYTRLNNDGMPVYSIDNMEDIVACPPQYKMAFLYFVVGQAQLRDSTETQDERATAFLNRFIAQLTSMPA